jgi:hypothetical protein
MKVTARAFALVLSIVGLWGSACSPSSSPNADPRGEGGRGSAAGSSGAAAPGAGGGGTGPRSEVGGTAGQGAGSGGERGGEAAGKGGSSPDPDPDPSPATSSGGTGGAGQAGSGGGAGGSYGSNSAGGTGGSTAGMMTSPPAVAPTGAAWGRAELCDTYCACMGSGNCKSRQPTDCANACKANAGKWNIPCRIEKCKSANKDYADQVTGSCASAAGIQGCWDQDKLTAP